MKICFGKTNLFQNQNKEFMWKMKIQKVGYSFVENLSRALQNTRRFEVYEG